MYRRIAASIILLTLTLIACMPVASPLVVAVPTSAARTSTATEPSINSPPTDTATSPSSEAKIPTATVPPERAEVVHYVVQDGDSLSSIAEHFSLSLESVLFSNSGVTPHNLEPGITLVIPPMDGFYYTWEEGVTIAKVAHQFDVSIHSIVNWHGNGLHGRIDDIEPGTTLFIPGGQISYLKINQSTPPAP